MTHLTVEEIIEFVSFDKLNAETLALSTKVNEHIWSCPSCLKKVCFKWFMMNYAKSAMWRMKNKVFIV